MERGMGEGKVDLVLVDDKRFKHVLDIEIKCSNHYYEMPQDLLCFIQFCYTNQLHAVLIAGVLTIRKEHTLLWVEIYLGKTYSLGTSYSYSTRSFGTRIMKYCLKITRILDKKDMRVLIYFQSLRGSRY